MADVRCFECDAPAKHQHHVIPRSLGGTRTVPLCEHHHGIVHGADLRTSALTKAAMVAKIARGELAGTVPFGFAANSDGRLRLNASEQETVVAVREMRANRMPLRAVVAELARRGIMSRAGRPFALTQVARIVTGARVHRDIKTTES